MLSISDKAATEGSTGQDTTQDTMLHRAFGVRDSPRHSSGLPSSTALGTPADVERDGENAPLLGGDGDVPQAPPKQNSILLPGLMYVATSSSLILLNKHALASFGFGCPNAILLFHCLLAVVLVKASQLMGWIRLEPLKWPLIKVWIPVNLLFVGRRKGKGEKL
jgi:hypothetical protein